MMDKPELLETIKSSIEKMNKHHQIEILRILSKQLCKLNENKSGVYVNLTYITDEVIEELQKYIEYTKEQEETLVTTEYQKEEFKASLFNNDKEDKDNITLSYSELTR
jgi:hypothetical protein